MRTLDKRIAPNVKLAASLGARATPPDAVNTFAPQLGILSARHESQYSRLFRS